jgi:hypothetical protein
MISTSYMSLVTSNDMILWRITYEIYYFLAWAGR